MDIRLVDNATVIGCAVRQIEHAIELLDSLNIKDGELTDVQYSGFRGNIRHIDNLNRSLDTYRLWMLGNKND